MNLCLNTFVIQFPDDFLDTCLVTVPRALLLRYAGRGHCKDEDRYKECWSHVEFSISLTRHEISDRASENDVRMLSELGIRTGRGSLHRIDGM